MQDINLLSYFPELGDIPESRVLETRLRLQQYLREGWPDLDSRPNSPFGDLHLTPLAYMVTALEISAGKMFSDIQLENVARGIIYSCPFVEGYLKNFAVKKEEAVSWGSIRVVFRQDKTYTLNRNAMFLFGGNNIFQLRLPNSGDLTIHPSGFYPVPVGSNGLVLKPYTENLYSVDIPVIGKIETSVSDGETATTDLRLPEINSIAALDDFFLGSPRNETLAKMAQKTRSAYYSSTLTTRNGAVNFINQAFPDITSVSAIISGDKEMSRDIATAVVGVPEDRLDVYIKTRPYYLTDTVQVQLKYNADAKKFVGKLDVPGVVVKVISINAQQTDNLGFTIGVSDTATIYSKSKDKARAPLLSCAYTELEELWVTIPMPAAAIDTTPHPEGESYAVFEVTYYHDPNHRSIASVLEASDNRPGITDVLTRSFYPVWIENFVLSYLKEPGASVNMKLAKSEIIDYVNATSGPEFILESEISDAMLYAGASGVYSLSFDATVRLSPANKMLSEENENLEINLIAAENSSLPVPELYASRINEINQLEFTDQAVGSDQDTYGALGRRNLTFHLMDVELREVKW